MKSLACVGTLLYDQDKLSEAKAYYKKCLELRIESFGYYHLDTLKSMNNLGNLYWNQYKFSEAEPLRLRDASNSAD